MKNLIDIIRNQQIDNIKLQSRKMFFVTGIEEKRIALQKKVDKILNKNNPPA